MWSPTHIEVTILRARNLLTKGKNGTNNCFVTIGMDKEKYQTSVKEKAGATIIWEEACELKIPDQGNRAELVLTCLHRNNLGLDEFLGQITLPLNTMDVYDRPRQRWYKLESKPGKEKKNKERGELEARIGFIVKSGSLSDLTKKEKHKSSIGQLASTVGGSLLSIGTIEKRKGIKKFAKSLGSKMQLHSRKRLTEGDEGSYNGSLASLGTPSSSNSGSRRHGQHPEDADPGVISEDDDEFAFDNLSHKSSGSSLNIRGQHQAKQPSPMLLNGKVLGKRPPPQPDIPDPELEQIENDFSIRARTLPPPSKPPRTPLQLQQDNAVPIADKQLDEWESKLYGSSLEVGSVNSLKRRSWEQARLPVAAEHNEQKLEQKKLAEKEQDTTSSSSSEDELEEEPHLADLLEEQQPEAVLEQKKPKDLSLLIPPEVTPRIHLMTPEEEGPGFQKFNASFAKFEQSAKIQDNEAFLQHEAKQVVPQPLPRINEQRIEQERLKKQEEEKAAAKMREEMEKQKQLEQERQRVLKQKAEEEEKQRKIEQQKIALEKQRLAEEEEREKEKQRREAKRREEDQRLLNFAKRTISGESEGNTTSTPEQSPKERGTEKRDKRLSKFKYFSKRDKNEDDRSSSSPKSTERIIIGHEKSMTHAERRSEISAALTKKYEGKSRDELMLIANGMENEALLQRQRVKELEDYLDNLLLRVMETHPKILQSPYSRTTSAKSG